MKYGKRICETLKAIRSEIADANEIDYTPVKCDHEGDCAGTCPACESETRWLERQLRMRHALGKAVTIAGVSVALSVAASAATPSSLDVEQIKRPNNTRPLKGKVPMPPEEKNDSIGNEQEDESELEIKADTIINENGEQVIVRKFTTGIVDAPPKLSKTFIYSNVDVEAQFPDGDEALDSLIKDQLYIPDEILAPIKEVGGTVKARCIVKALVEIDGTISDAVIEKTTTSPVFDEEALRVVKNLPNFIPARKSATLPMSDDHEDVERPTVPVRSWKLIPVEFVYDFSGKE